MTVWPCSRLSMREQIEQFHLVRDVQVGGRLVEQHQRGLLCEHHRHPDPLPLTAGQFVDQPARELGTPVAAHRLGDRRLIVCATTGASASGAGNLPRATRSATLIPSGAIEVWGSRPSRRATSLVCRRRDVASRPGSPVPAEGFSSRASPRSSVDLPHALGPTIDRDPPSSTSTRQLGDDRGVFVTDREVCGLQSWLCVVVESSFIGFRRAWVMSR